jgi:hypothetical protein
MKSRMDFSVWIGLSIGNEVRALFIRYDKMETIQQLGKIATIDCSVMTKIRNHQNKEQ